MAIAVSALLLGTSCTDTAGSAGSGDNPSSAQEAGQTPELLANDSSDPANPDRGCVDAETLCIGLAIAPGAIPLSYLLDDLERIEASHESIVEVLQADDVTHLGYKVEDFASESFDIIIVAGDPSGTLISRSAAEYPETVFVSLEAIPASDEAANAAANGSGPVLPENLVSLSFAYQEAGFLAGSLAALTTETGKVAAIIGPDSDPAAVEFKTGFEAGAQFINPQIQLFTSFHPDSVATGFDDPLWASGKTREVIEQGVDIVAGFGGITGGAVLVEAARQEGAVLCIGAVVDHRLQTPEAQRCLIASSEVGLDHILYETIDALLAGSGSAVVGDGSWTSPVPANLGLVDNGISAGDGADSRVSGDVVAQMDEIARALRDGSLSSN